MDDACAEGIADEHYRLEGRLGLLSSLYSSFCLLHTSAAAACSLLLPLYEGL